jgi:hypothetical protein
MLSFAPHVQRRSDCKMNLNTYNHSRTISCLVLTVIVLSSVVVRGRAQDQNTTREPKTKIEAFEAQSGSVVIRGFSKIGEMKGVYGGNLTVQSIEFVNAATGKREYGITVDVKETDHLERSNRSFIDYDEIDSLVKGIDYVLKTDKSVTKLDNFQADYRTKGDLHISIFSTPGSNNETMASLESGSIGSTSMFLKISDVQKFREFITAAKAKLDTIK